MKTIIPLVIGMLIGMAATIFLYKSSDEKKPYIDLPEEWQDISTDILPSLMQAKFSAKKDTIYLTFQNW